MLFGGGQRPDDRRHTMRSRTAYRRARHVSVAATPRRLGTSIVEPRSRRSFALRSRACLQRDRPDAGASSTPPSPARAAPRATTRAAQPPHHPRSHPWQGDLHAIRERPTRRPGVHRRYATCQPVPRRLVSRFGGVTGQTESRCARGRLDRSGSDDLASPGIAQRTSSRHLSAVRPCGGVADHFGRRATLPQVSAQLCLGLRLC